MVWFASRVISKIEIEGARSRSTTGGSSSTDETVEVFGPSAVVCLPGAAALAIAGAPLAAAGLGAWGAFSAFMVARSILKEGKQSKVPRPPDQGPGSCGTAS